MYILHCQFERSMHLYLRYKYKYRYLQLLIIYRCNIVFESCVFTLELEINLS